MSRNLRATSHGERRSETSIVRPSRRSGHAPADPSGLRLALPTEPIDRPGVDAASLVARSTTPSDVSAVRLEGVKKTSGDVVALDGLDLDVRDGAFFSMLGPSGSGKTP